MFQLGEGNLIAKPKLDKWNRCKCACVVPSAHFGRKYSPDARRGWWLPLKGNAFIFIYSAFPTSAKTWRGQILLPVYSLTYFVSNQLTLAGSTWLVLCTGL